MKGEKRDEVHGEAIVFVTNLKSSSPSPVFTCEVYDQTAKKKTDNLKKQKL